MFASTMLSSLVRNNVIVTRNLHVSRPRPALPPYLLLLAKPLSRVTAALIGRTARSWWRKLPNQRKAEVKQKLFSHRRKFQFAGASFLGGLVYAYESHIQECPVTGRRRYFT